MWFYEWTRTTSVFQVSTFVAEWWTAVANGYSESPNTYNWKKLSVKNLISSFSISFDWWVTEAFNIPLSTSWVSIAVNALITENSVLFVEQRWWWSHWAVFFVWHLWDWDSSFYEDLAEQNVAVFGSVLIDDSWTEYRLDYSAYTAYWWTRNAHDLFIPYKLIVRESTWAWQVLWTAKNYNWSRKIWSSITSTHHIWTTNYSLISSDSTKKFKL